MSHTHRFALRQGAPHTINAYVAPLVPTARAAEAVPLAANAPRATDGAVAVSHPRHLTPAGREALSAFARRMRELAPADR